MYFGRHLLGYMSEKDEQKEDVGEVNLHSFIHSLIHQTIIDCQQIKPILGTDCIQSINIIPAL